MAVAQKTSFNGKYPLITFRIRCDFPRPAPEVVAKFERFFVLDVSDQVGRMYTMDGSIQSLYTPAPKLVGTALTVKCAPGDNLGVKKALYLVKPGDVLVIDAQGFTEWCLGGFGMLVRSIRERGLKASSSTVPTATCRRRGPPNSRSTLRAWRPGPGRSAVRPRATSRSARVA